MTPFVYRQDVKETHKTLSEKKTSSANRTSTEFSTLLTALSQKKTDSKQEKQEKIAQAIQNASRKYNLDPSLIRAVIKQESGFNPCAESHCGARGLMQLMPQTAKDMGIGVDDLLDIDKNIDGGSRYLRQMLDRFDGNLEYAVAAYNAGPGAVEKHNGIPPYKETQNYVPSVLAHYQDFNKDSKAGFDFSPVKSLLDTQGTQDVVASVISSTIATTVSLIASTPVRMPERNQNEEPPPPPNAVYV